jgi:hypothetical protein
VEDARICEGYNGRRVERPTSRGVSGFVLLAKYRVKDDEMGKEYSMNGGKAKNI